MSGHTPGPWRLDGDDVNRYGPSLVGVYVAQEEGGRICECFANCLVRHDETLRANARLIAAAPELLAALIEAEAALRAFDMKVEWEWGSCQSEEEMEAGNDWSECVYSARAAIAKATA